MNTAGFVSNNVHYQYGWRIQDKDKKKAFMCMAQTANERQEWVDSILAEREKVRGKAGCGGSDPRDRRRLILRSAIN